MTDNSIKTMDPNILLSIINTKLRDQYSSLDILCEELMITKDEVIKKLNDIGYNYNQSENQFK
ncbi:DUF4250 domain-containing protein [Clostridium saccharobutylicum]|uniref:DUF4250 domain-containing protein n=2 Tax=Clostridium saccharobutylicum TaxID=169679 RepID=U5MZP6_CLOSA|nr:DUF4250 domain-containing protein [Clostridium saccharobutylicum]AGX44977.1 hypothetical protein CLSA_c40170 [Clostridium saccharobutylicum DSM 13864]AQR92260.1 hypothetical protein CLOSC_39900 [Clostridium saccharobutylicum]AQS02162.1 hypothetical protein CSACC_39950 [Clostridium saccharobutylicum]AQS11766.1 hypothetical protein CLOBY_39240 [Clostridium saccharobutylicum]AQS16145.1 hypothetical protein CLOSACC_39950 [Clostridium saccharobutylicum]